MFDRQKVIEELRRIEVRAKAAYKGCTRHFFSMLSEYNPSQLSIELGVSAEEGLPESYYWYSVGLVQAYPDGSYKYCVKSGIDVPAKRKYEEVSCEEEMFTRLDDDYREYLRRIWKYRERKLALAIDAL